MSDENIPAEPEATHGESPPKHWWNRAILGASITSALGDLSYETGNVVLPGLIRALQVPVAVLGVAEGMADGLSSFTKLLAGYIGDRFGHRKTLVVFGYALTALGQAFLALATGAWIIILGRIVAWLGRGLRGPLRDAIMTAAVPPEQRGRAFGFHRAADTLGAILGPLFGTALLVWFLNWLQESSPDVPFRLVLGLAVIPGVLAVITFAVLVHDPGGTPNPKLTVTSAFGGLPGSFKRYLAAVGIYGCGDFAPTLLIMAATQVLQGRYSLVTASAIAGSLYVVRNVTQTVLSFPAGVLADRWGPKPILVAGYLFGVTSCALLAIQFVMGTPSMGLLAAVFIISGACMAVQETTEPLVTASLVQPEIRSTCYGLLGAVNGLGDFVSSAVVGALWTALAPQIAFAVAGATLLAGMLVLVGVSTKPSTLHS